jgi:hypothetical protein
MAHEHLIAELAALREKHTLDEVLEIVMVGLGGKEKVAAEMEEYDEDEPDTETPDPLSVMRDADVGRLENIQSMAESFCTWLHAKGAQQMDKDTDKAVDNVRQLSDSFNKAARAVRLTVVLKHEAAGLRPLPNVRVPAVEPANGNSPAGAAARPGQSGERVGSSERREETDAERTERLLNKHHNHLRALSAVLDEDLVDAPAEVQAEAKRESLAVRLTTIAAAIPHPRLDRKIADTYLGQLWDSLAPRYAEKPEALGPPDPEVLSQRSWNIDRHQRARARAAQRK